MKTVTKPYEMSHLYAKYLFCVQMTYFKIWTLLISASSPFLNKKFHVELSRKTHERTHLRYYELQDFAIGASFPHMIPPQLWCTLYVVRFTRQASSTADTNWTRYLSWDGLIDEKKWCIPKHIIGADYNGCSRTGYWHRICGADIGGNSTNNTKSEITIDKIIKLKVSTVQSLTRHIQHSYRQSR